MVYKTFSISLLVRLALLSVSLFALSLAIIEQGYYALSLLLLIIAIVQCIQLYQQLNKTNRELARFLTAIKNNDFSQRFKVTDKSTQHLIDSYNEILSSSTQNQQQQQQTLHHLKSMTEHIPVPLLSLYPDGKIILRNNAARKLFSSGQVNKIDDLIPFGDELFALLTSINSARSQQLVNFQFEEESRQLSVTISQITTGSFSEYLVSLMDIQSELDGAQIKAWENLIRVLTHEIMNSLTPIASLAKTSAELVNEVHQKLDQQIQEPLVFEALDDADQAAKTVAKRADGLMQFVQSYRSLTLMPTPTFSRICVNEIFNHLNELFTAKWQKDQQSIQLNISASYIELNADAKLLEQALINLLINAEQALKEQTNGLINISASINKRGLVVIMVEDNGPGIEADIIDQVFVPFFTTKALGSGVGLALTKHIMNAHNGFVNVSKSELGGAKFSLFF